MNLKIREAQLKVLNLFSQNRKSFALSGGTALELFYLKHRYSRDIDFFSPAFNKKEIQYLISVFKKRLGMMLQLENEFLTDNRARVIFYTLLVKGSSYPLKIDFVEDVLFEKPLIKKFNRIPVYDSTCIYFQKIVAITGTNVPYDAIGRERITGRGEIRDIVDVYYLSQKIEPLHLYMKGLPKRYQRGMVQWYRNFSRQEFKIGYLDLDMYDKNITGVEIIRYLENEIKTFITEFLI